MYRQCVYDKVMDPYREEILELERRIALLREERDSIAEFLKELGWRGRLSRERREKSDALGREVIALYLGNLGCA